MYDPQLVALLRSQGGATSPGTQMPGRRSVLGEGMKQQNASDPYSAIGQLGQAAIGRLGGPPASTGMGAGQSGVEGLISPVAPSSANPAGGLAPGGGGWSGFGEAASAAGPWAALAAAIVGNEMYAKKNGYRSTDDTTYAKDLLTGKVLSQDIEGRFNPFMDKVTGDLWGKSGLGDDLKMGSDIASFNLKDAWKSAKNSSLVKLLRGIF